MDDRHGGWFGEGREKGTSTVHRPSWAETSGGAECRTARIGCNQKFKVDKEVERCLAHPQGDQNP